MTQRAWMCSPLTAPGSTSLDRPPNSLHIVSDDTRNLRKVKFKSIIIFRIDYTAVNLGKPWSSPLSSSSSSPFLGGNRGFFFSMSSTSERISCDGVEGRRSSARWTCWTRTWPKCNCGCAWRGWYATAEGAPTVGCTCTKAPLYRENWWLLVAVGIGTTWPWNLERGDKEDALDCTLFALGGLAARSNRWPAGFERSGWFWTLDQYVGTSWPLCAWRIGNGEFLFWNIGA